MIETSNILVTGGAGSIGHAIAKRRKKDGWTGKMTVYSTDSHKHERMKREYPDINFVQGDIRNPDTLYNAMVGHDIVIHAAAVKIIPISEVYSMDTFDVNVNGSQCVCATALRAGIKIVLGISTDKAVHAVNAYGATKYMMEKMFQEYARGDFDTQFLLTRYGNVLESNGSVIEAWKKAVERGERINITDPEMTRFWLSPAHAVRILLLTLACVESGQILIPILPGLSIGRMADYVVGMEESDHATLVPVRPGEKTHEELLSSEESFYARYFEAKENDIDYIILNPTTSKRNSVFADRPAPLISNVARTMTKDELIELLKND